MIGIRTAVVVTQIIGAMWALIALIYSNDLDEARRDFLIALGVIAAGFTVWLVIEWIEHRR